MAFVPLEDSENILAGLLAENADLRARLAIVEAAQNNSLRLDQLKSMFFVTINHELRTLISLILGPAELLLQQASLIQDVRQAQAKLRKLTPPSSNGMINGQSINTVC